MKVKELKEILSNQNDEQNIIFKSLSGMEWNILPESIIKYSIKANEENLEPIILKIK